MIDKDIEILQEKMINKLKNQNSNQQLEFDFSVKLPVFDTCQVTGATCQSCFEFYPYAELKPHFKCWSCKNS
jgi:hypothetical protein